MKQGIIIVFITITLKVAQIIKETYYFSFFAASDVYAEFISSKATFDLLLIPFTSVFFFEQTYRNNVVQIPAVPIALILIFASVISYDINFIEIHLIILIYAILASFSNSLVVLCKDFGSTKLNVLINGFEHYIVAGLVFSMYILRLEVGIEQLLIVSGICQLTVSFYVMRVINLRGVQRVSVNFGLSFGKDVWISCFVASSVIVVITYLRFDLGQNSDVVVNNYALVIGAMPALLFDRFLEYSGQNRSGMLEFVPKLFVIWLIITVGIFSFYTDVALLLSKSAVYFLGLSPFVFLFTHFRHERIYVLQFIVILLFLLLGFVIETDKLMLILGFISWFFVFFNRWRNI